MVSLSVSTRTMRKTVSKTFSDVLSILKVYLIRQPLWLNTCMAGSWTVHLIFVCAVLLCNYLFVQYSWLRYYFCRVVGQVIHGSSLLICYIWVLLKQYLVLQVSTASYNLRQMHLSQFVTEWAVVSFVDKNHWMRTVSLDSRWSNLLYSCFAGAACHACCKVAP
jgi:hypothetical protein